MKRTSFAGVALITLAAAVAGGQETARIQVSPESKLWVDGTSNLHDWSCKATTLEAAVELDAAAAAQVTVAAPKMLKRVQVKVPVKSLKCGHGKMDDNMYKALKAEQFPEIKYVLSTYEVDKAKTTADGFAAITKGELTVAGQTKEIEIPITALRKDGGSMRGEGAVALKMTDFGIKPPTAMLGALKTKDDIRITFNVLLDKSTVVALSQR